MNITTPSKIESFRLFNVHSMSSDSRPYIVPTNVSFQTQKNESLIIMINNEKTAESSA